MMIICTLRTLKAFNSKGRIIDVPEGTYISLPPIKANLLIDLGLARPVDFLGLDNTLHCFYDYEHSPYESETVH